MDLLNKYPDRIKAEDRFTPDDFVAEMQMTSQTSLSSAGQVMTGILALIISVAAGFIG